MISRPKGPGKSHGSLFPKTFPEEVPGGLDPCYSLVFTSVSLPDEASNLLNSSFKMHSLNAHTKDKRAFYFTFAYNMFLSNHVNECLNINSWQKFQNS